MTNSNIWQRIEDAVIDRLPVALQERKIYMTQALHGEDVLDHIVYEGTPTTFAKTLINTLSTHDPNGKQLIRVLRIVRNGASIEKRHEIDTLIATLRTAYTNLPVPVSGVPYGSSIADLISDPKDIPDLPHTTVGLVGREAFQQQVHAELDKTGQVLIYGLGGSGKSALASQVIYDWMSARKSHVNILHIRAGSMDTDSLLAGLAYPIDPQAVATASKTHDKVRVLRNLLNTAKISLVFIDDARDPSALRAVSKAIPRGVRLVVTSRQRRMSAAVVSVVGLKPIYLPDMESENAVALMQKIVTDHNINLDAAARLCDKLSNMAYAVRVAAMTMQRQGISASNMLQRIEKKRETATLFDGFSEPGQQSFTQLIEASLDGLDDEARTVFMAAGAFFTPTITAEMLDIYLNYQLLDSNNQDGAWRAAKTNESPSIDVHAALQQLVEHGLFIRIPETETTTVHYRSHDLSHSYVNARTTINHQHHAMLCCIAYIYNYNEPSVSNYNALQTELANFVGASSWAFEQELWAEAKQFARVLYIDGGNRFLAYRRLHHDAMNMLKRAMTASKNASRPRNDGEQSSAADLAYSDAGK